MKNKLTRFTAAIAGTALLVSGTALPAFAQTAAAGAGVGISASVGAAGAGVAGTAGTTVIQKAQQRADQEITRRITALNALSTRINAMTKIASSSQASLSATIQTQIAAMNTLQTQIAGDASADSTSSLKADIQSITKSYRIFALVIPQGSIEAAADRVLDVADMMTTLAGQLQGRVTTDAETSALTDMNTQVANANTSVNAAVSEVANLQPDNGNQTIQQSNTAALKDARTKVQAAQQDLTAARKDAGTIVKALSAAGVSASGSASASTSAQ